MFRFVLYTILLFPIAGYSQSFSGRIVRVIDGDAFLFQTADSTFTVHLYGIDAPEYGQTYWEQTTDYLETHLWADAKIHLIKDINQEGLSALLIIKRKNINRHLVRNGYAWYNRIHTINADLARSEEHARNKKLGLWASDTPNTPWDFKLGKLPKPPPPDGKYKVLICARQKSKRYHKRYCRGLKTCNDNVIVILRKQARDLKMKACKYCY